MFAFGDAVLNIFTLKGFPDPWYWFLDDSGSQYWLQRGFEDADKARLEEIFGHIETDQERIQRIIDATYQYSEGYCEDQ